jgi:hypothetical protein
MKSNFTKSQKISKNYIWKKLFLSAIIFVSPIVFAQNANWDYATSQIYTPAAGFSPKKVLLDKAPMFADLYNFNYPEHNTSSSAHFKQAISELYAASSQQYFTNPSSLPYFEDVAEHASEILVR